MGEEFIKGTSIALSIQCVDCLGPAYLLNGDQSDREFKAGDILLYRCRDCGDRWDIEVDQEDLTPPPQTSLT